MLKLIIAQRYLDYAKTEKGSSSFSRRKWKKRICQYFQCRSSRNHRLISPWAKRLKPVWNSSKLSLETTLKKTVKELLRIKLETLRKSKISAIIRNPMLPSKLPLILSRIIKRNLRNHNLIKYHLLHNGVSSTTSIIMRPLTTRGLRICRKDNSSTETVQIMTRQRFLSQMVKLPGPREIRLELRFLQVKLFLMEISSRRSSIRTRSTY